MISKIKNLIHIIRKMSNFDEVNFKIGCSHFNLMKNYYPKIKTFSETGYKVFSQNGEDGFIDYLLFSLDITNLNLLKLVSAHTRNPTLDFYLKELLLKVW